VTLDRAQLPRQFVVLDEVGDTGTAHDPSPTVSERSTPQDGDPVASAHQPSQPPLTLHELITHPLMVARWKRAESTSAPPRARTSSRP
jgi:hypothetical protein